MASNGERPCRGVGRLSRNRRTPVVQAPGDLVPWKDSGPSIYIHHTPMINKSAASVSSEYAAFSTALKKILKVSYSEMHDKLQAEKKAKASKPRPSASSSRVRSGKH